MDVDLNILMPKPDAPLLQIQRGGKMLIELDWKGGAVFGEDYTPDGAVGVFWESLRLSPDMMEKLCKANGYTVVKDEADDPA